MSQDPANHRLFLDERDESQPRAAAGTRQDVDPKRALHQCCPLLASSSVPPDVRATRSVSVAGVGCRQTATVRIGSIDVDHVRTPCGPGPEHAVVQLFEAADRDGVRRIIFISSLAAYDGCASLYGRGKREVEKAVLARGGHAIRPGTVFGPRPRGMMGSLSAQITKKGWVPVIRHPRALYLAHEDDLANLVARLAAGELPSATVPWLAAGSRAWTLEELLQEIARRAGRAIQIVPLPWRLVWGGLRVLEGAGFKPSFRSDSVLSLAHPIPPAQMTRLHVSPLAPFRNY